MKNKYFKLGLVALTMIAGTALQAQTTSGDIAQNKANVLNGTVRVIDNKGTIKYLQAANGITTLTNSSTDVTTTTWQLGGTLTVNTYIDVDGNAFALDGIELVDNSILAASTDATDQSDHGTGTGWTLLVRDEVTGATKKLQATDLIQSGHERFSSTTTSPVSATASGSTLTLTLTGSPTLPAFEQVHVYRNGAKLIAGVDYTIGATVGTVEIKPNGTAPYDWAVNAEDIIEVHYIK